MISVKILGYKSPQRYAIQRTVVAAQIELHKAHPDLEVTITEVKELEEILRYTPVFVFPSLAINEKLVCVGRFPKKEEVVQWLQEVIE